MSEITLETPQSPAEAPPAAEEFSSDAKGMREAAASLREDRAAGRGYQHREADASMGQDLPIVKYSDSGEPREGFKAYREAADEIQQAKKSAIIRAALAQGSITEDEARAALEGPIEEPLPRRLPRLDEDGNLAPPLKDWEKITSDDAISEREAVREMGEVRERLADLERERLEAQQQLNEQAAAEEWDSATGQEQEAEAGQSDEGQHEAYLAEERQRVEAERQAIEHWKRLSFGEAHLTNELQEIFNHAQTAFPDVKSPQDLERLRVAQPARFTAYMQVHQAAVQKQALLQAHSVQRVEMERQAQEAAQQQRAAYAQEQDAKFAAELSKHLPQYANGKQGELQQAAANTLRNLGVTEEQIAAHYHGGAPIDMRSSAVQIILAKAAAYDDAVARSKQVTKALTTARATSGHCSPRRGSGSRQDSVTQ